MLGTKHTNLTVITLMRYNDHMVGVVRLHAKLLSLFSDFIGLVLLCIVIKTERKILL